MILYKYRPCDKKAWDIIKSCQLYSAQPSKLNDPLDCSIDIEEEYKRALKIVSETDTHPDGRDTFLMTLLNSSTRISPQTGQPISLCRSVQEWIASHGILSMSMTATDPLLWSHYADGHRGICLGFDQALMKIDPLSVSAPINYLDSPPYIELFNELSRRLKEFCRPWENVHYSDEVGDEFFSLQIFELAKANLLTKSSKWKYEQEFRIISSKPGLRSFDPEALVEVICGTRMTVPDQNYLASLIGDPKFSHVKIKNVRQRSGSFEFEVFE